MSDAHRVDGPMTTSLPRRRPAHPARRGPLSVASAGALVLLLTACAAAAEDDAARAADAFAADLRDDPGAACDLLAPRTRADLEDRQGSGCSEALPAAGLRDPGRRVDVTVAGQSAMVRFGGDTVFLARFHDGWRVVAAGCERRSTDSADPYDCAVEGG